MMAEAGRTANAESREDCHDGHCSGRYGLVQAVLRRGRQYGVGWYSLRLDFLTAIAVRKLSGGDDPVQDDAGMTAPARSPARLQAPIAAWQRDRNGSSSGPLSPRPPAPADSPPRFLEIDAHPPDTWS